MKAYVYSGVHDLGIQEVQKPSLALSGALAKIEHTSICGTDIRAYRFGSTHIDPPRIIGHEALYRLEWVSDEFTGQFQPGEQVLVAPAIGCGHCKACLSGNTNRCDDLQTIGFEYDGTFAEYVVIPEQAFRMGNVISLSGMNPGFELTVVEPIACALNGQEFLNIKPGENVLIFGAGFLGSIHADLASLKGAKHVIVAEISEKKRSLAKSSLSDAAVIDSGDPNLGDVISEITHGEGVDVVITACPAGVTHKQALELINKGGRVSLFGGLPGESTGFLDSNLIHYKELGVFGVHASSPAHNREALKYVTQGGLEVSKYLTVFPFDDIQKAFSSLIDESVVKAVLEF